MNFRMDGQHVRFRITKDELGLLCDGQMVARTTHLTAQSSLTISIRPVDRLIDRPLDEGPILALEQDMDRLTLLVLDKAASDLLTALPQREGLEETVMLEDGRDLRLSLDVDIRSQRRKRA